MFDCVIANPPFSLEKWGGEVWASDPYGRNFAGMPPEKSGDYAWVQHMIKSMAPKSGRTAVVLPHGALFRMGKEGEIRKKILGMDLLEAVIGLGGNLFYGTSVPIPSEPNLQMENTRLLYSLFKSSLGLSRKFVSEVLLCFGEIELVDQVIFSCAALLEFADQKRV
jgi:N-6 DNA Methylase